MASLIENLIIELNEEYAVYEQLLDVSMEKTSAIISNDLERLRKTTEKEQYFVDAVTSLERKRRETMAGIESVLGKNEEMRIIDVVECLESQPEFHDPLLLIDEKLGKLAHRLKEVNSHNQNLIQESLSMIEYNINLLQNMNRAPETAEYNKEMFRGAKNFSGVDAPMGKFDAKQ